MVALEQLKQTWSSEEITSLYEAAYAHYQSGQYEKASELFLQLVLIRPFIDPHWRGLASSYQMLGKYKEALKAWGHAALLADENPMPHLHAAECLFSIHEKEEAQKALNCASARLKNDESSEPLRKKIELMRQFS